jgi:cysteine-rich repeat protein
VDAGEECDDGAGNSNTAADACRVACLNPSCGDSVVDSGEECDDGNIADGDGCSSLCADEGDEDDDKGGGGCSLIR